MDNFDRKLRFIYINLLFIKLFIFINNLFIINYNYNFQIEYIIILENKKYNNKEFN